MDVNRTELQRAREQTLHKFLAMGKGDGEESYSKNSGLQATLGKMSLSTLNEALEKLTFPSEGGRSVVVVDLGSSSGPNTIESVSFIIDKLRNQMTRKDVEFQAYFNDLPSNDFNNLFQQLSNDTRAKNFYIAGVPGSFYHRLFAQSSVHVFFSSSCLHWISKIPDAVLDRNSPAYNRGSSWLLYSHSAIAKAYQQQASMDLRNFLLARAAELMSGGVLFFCCLGRSTSKPNDPTNCSVDDLQVRSDEVWSDLVREGVVTEHQRDTYNIPFYLRNIEDVREAIVSCSSMFDVLTAKLEPIDVNFAKLYGTSEATAVSRKIVAFWKAVFNYVTEVHVGQEASEVFWQRLEKSYEKRIRMSNQDPKFTGQLCIVSLIRN